MVSKPSLLLLLFLTLAGVCPVMVGLPLSGALVSVVAILLLGILAFVLISDSYKRSIRETAEELDCSKLDYRLRVVCKALGVKVYVVDNSKFFGIAVLPPGVIDRKPLIFVTKLARNLLPAEALNGIIGHEVGHLIKKHYLSTITLLTADFITEVIVVYGTLARFGYVVSVLASVISAVLLTYVTIVLHRRMEFDADLVSMRIVGPEKIILSLKSVNTLVGGGKSSLLDTHPPIEDRIRNIKLATLTKS